MKIIAHRCGTDCYPEQTIAAAQHSLNIGADLVEVDIRFTKDDVPVVIHDPTPERIFQCSPLIPKTPVSQLSCMEFLALRRVESPAFCGHRFEDYLKCGITCTLLHIKEGGPRLSQILDLCRKYDTEKEIVFGVQSAEDAHAVKSYDSAIRVLAFMPSPEDAVDFAKAGSDFIRLWEQWCTPENIIRVKSTGKKLWVMTCDPEVGEVSSEEKYKHWAQIGCDGILVNRVLPAVEFFKQNKT